MKINKRPGVYKIENTQSGMVYIGSSTNVDNRVKQHLEELFLNKHGNSKLQLDYNKCGTDSFKATIIEEAPASILRYNLYLLEQKWLDSFSSRVKYNILKDATGHLKLKVLNRLRKDVGLEPLQPRRKPKKNKGTTITLDFANAEVESMSDFKIGRNNRIIAKFDQVNVLKMLAKNNLHSGVLAEGEMFVCVIDDYLEHLKYHCSWDWLMPVYRAVNEALKIAEPNNHITSHILLGEYLLNGDFEGFYTELANTISHLEKRNWI